MSKSFNTNHEPNQSKSDIVPPALSPSGTTNSPLSYYLIARLKSEDYHQLYSHISKVADKYDGIPIRDIHFTLQAFTGNINKPTLTKDLLAT